MCTGVEIALIAATAVSAVGAVAAGEQQSAMAEYNAKVAENDAAASRAQAAFAESQHRLRLSRLLSTQKTNAAASGIDVASGSPLAAMADTAAMGELDALAIRYGGEVKATNAYAQAGLDHLKGAASRQAGYFGAATSLLGGASRVGIYNARGTLPPEGNS